MGDEEMHTQQLTQEERERYSRQMLLAGVGEAGQRKLLASKVLIVGAGGLGSPAAMYLVASGVGEIGVVDDDDVDISNLQRQIAHRSADVGRKKADSLARALAALNPAVRVNVYRERFSEDNAEDILCDRSYDFVLDCTDNFPTKFLINDACVRLQKPFVHAGVVGFDGQIMTIVPGKGPCYRCIFEDVPKEGTVPTSHEIGILGAVPGILGTLQATEALKYILGLGELLVGRMLIYDALRMSFRTVKLPQRNACCTVCGEEAGV